MTIHETAIIHPSAELDSDVDVGPFSIIEEGVQVGAGTKIGPHCYLAKGTRMGQRNQLTAFVSLGTPPQDLRHQDCESLIEIGDDNTFREFVSMNRGTPKEESLTRVGSGNFFMGQSHVGHDCQIGSHIVVTNCVLLAGHCHVGDYVVMSAYVGVHQYTTIGRCSYIGGKSRVFQDVPPFVKIAGDPAEVRMVNEIGMQRASIEQADVDEVKHVYRTIFRRGSSVLEEAHQLINDDSPLVRELAEFLLRKEAGRYGRFRESLRAH